MVVDMHRTYSCRCAGIDDVARLESEEAAYVAHYFVDLKHHVARHALLHGVSVDVEMEMQRLEVEEFLLGYPFAYGSRTVEALKQVPRHAFCPHLFLYVACGEVDAEGHGIVISVGETFGNTFAETADAYHDLSLVVHLFRPVGNEKWLVVFK